jgi:hypothetical protein
MTDKLSPEAVKEYCQLMWARPLINADHINWFNTERGERHFKVAIYVERGRKVKLKPARKKGS